MDKKIVSNLFYNIIYKVLIVIAPIITTPYVSRVLGPAGVGDYSYTYSIAFAFSLFAALGVNTYGQREVAYNQDNLYKRSKAFFEILFLRIITTGITLGIYIICCIEYNDYSIYLLLQGFIIFAVPLDISWYYQGIENFKIVALRNLVVKVLTVFLIFALVKTEDDVWLYILINSISIFLSNLLYFIKIHKDLVKVSLKTLDIKKHFRGAFEFFIPLIAVEIYSQLDKIMLGLFTVGSVENGYYEQARKITTLIVSILVAINTVMMPRVSNLYARGEKEKIIDFYKKSFDFMQCLLFPMALGLIVVSANFTEWFFGEGYDKVSVLLQLSSVIIVFMCIGNFVGVQYLSPTGNQNKMTVAYVTAAVINILLNLILIPRYYSIGALIASILAESISCFIQLYLIYKSEYKFRMFQNTWKYITAAVTMVLLIFIIDMVTSLSGIWLTLLEVVTGASFYFAMLFLLKEDIIVGLVRNRRL